MQKKCDARYQNIEITANLFKNGVYIENIFLRYHKSEKMVSRMKKFFIDPEDNDILKICEIYIDSYVTS